ncbi:MAPEG family protein [Denitrobaculum tricleocarpae]|uniref:MAPEG family protein n=1 Tax=Denitrobaculum tricleocarpae TaxID=2591009 RepID=UPI001C552CF7|nr:MAPEG family protein [Denitrobaculum tricleocarpae]
MNDLEMPITVTPFYAALAALLLVVLSIRVIRQRRLQKVAIGDGENPALRRAMRVQANFIEYAPLTFLLIAFAELQGVPAVIIHLLAAFFVAARALHAFGVAQETENFRFRVIGMAVTFFVLIAAALINLGVAVAGWLF